VGEQISKVAYSRDTNRLVTESRGVADILPALVLILSDGVSCVLSLAISATLFAWPAQFAMVLLTGAVSFGVGAALFGLYPGRGMLGPVRVRLRTILALVAFLSPAVVLAALHAPNFQLDVITCLAAGALLAFLGSLLELATIWLADWAGIWRTPAIFLGDADTARSVASDLMVFPELGLKLVDTRENGRPAMDLIATHSNFPTTGARDFFLVDASAPLPAFFPMRRIAASHANGGRDFLPRLAKRSMDIVIAASALLFLSPIFALTMLAVLLHDGAPVFYFQLRGGKDGTSIRVWKFRSMYRDAGVRLQRLLENDPKKREEWERSFKLRDDPRILPRIGTFIRKSSIDELPQLWNVLKGDMSIVGPRPFPPEHLAAFSKEFQNLRATVIPGITGLWQVTLRSDGELDEQERLDRSYITGWSLWLDIYIILRTPLALLTSRGAR
jgi:lipopolysaccharide/colanic/teichoic acid biosynthesis glycosyltransferase